MASSSLSDVNSGSSTSTEGTACISDRVAEHHHLELIMVGSLI